jgi:ATP-dependent helicase HrpA
VADVREQLAGLAGPGYLTKAGLARLPSVARYLRAIERRLDKLPDNPGRDAQLMAVIHGVADEYADALAALAPESRATEKALAPRWMIEELRVSLFAQTLGTPAPVSERRIRTLISALLPGVTDSPAGSRCRAARSFPARCASAARSRTPSRLLRAR